MKDFSVTGKVAAVLMSLGLVVFCLTLWSLHDDVDAFGEEVLKPAQAAQHKTLNMGYVAPERPKRRAKLIEVEIDPPSEPERRPGGIVLTSALPVVVVTASNLNLRAEPSFDSDQVALFPRGTRLAFLRQTSGQWLRVRDDARDISGWVYGRYVEGGHRFR